MIEERYVSVGLQQLHVHVGGVAGSLPPVVLEAGGGSILQTWKGVEQSLAAQTTLLSYERAGIGSSSGPVDGVLAQSVAQRLDALLEAVGIREPAILVGHSLGGLYMRYYAATRPERVAGLVLLDTTPQDLPFPRCFSVKPVLVLWLLHGLSRTGLLDRLAKRLKAAGKANDLSDEHLDSLRRFLHVKTVLREIGALRKIQAQVAALTPKAPVPTLTISAGRHDAKITQDHIERFRHSHEALAALGAKPYSHHHRMEGATHMSMLTDPANAAKIGGLILEFARQIRTATSA